MGFQRSSERLGKLPAWTCLLQEVFLDIPSSSGNSAAETQSVLCLNLTYLPELATSNASAGLSMALNAV